MNRFGFAPFLTFVRVRQILRPLRMVIVKSYHIHPNVILEL